MQSLIASASTIIPCSVGVLVLLWAALHDIAARTIPNWMSLVLAALGLVLRVEAGQFFLSLIAGVVVFMAAAFCWRRGWMGGGDVKLLGAATIFVPPHAVFAMLIFVAFAGGGLAFLYIAARYIVSVPEGYRPSSFFGRVLRIEAWRIRRGGPLPYACAIAAGVFMALYRIGA